MPDTQDWWLILRRAFGIPDIVAPQRTLEMLSQLIQGGAARENAVSGVAYPNDRGEIQEMLRSLVAAATAGDLDGYLLGGQADSVPIREITIPHDQFARFRWTAKRLYEYISAQPEFRDDLWQISRGVEFVSEVSDDDLYLKVSLSSESESLVGADLVVTVRSSFRDSVLIREGLAQFTPLRLKPVDVAPSESVVPLLVLSR